MMGSYGSESLFNASRDGGNKDLAIALMRADSEQEVIAILKKWRYWDDDSVWREYGDDPQNYSTIGNQQSSADNALVEKLVNSVDAVLMRECVMREIYPESDEAPQSMAEAQREFFGIRDGKLSNMSVEDRAKLAKDILLIATGSKKKPSLSIIDKGEGQSPKRMPETILSLTKDNKIKIPFVQGKFGMGGTGVLRFCSEENSLMLVISKRNHEIDVQTDEKIDPENLANDETRDLWGVTVVRREDPKGKKNSHYTYLAPDDKILFFNSDKLPIFENVPSNMVDKVMESGTYFKLYEYDIGRGLSSVITFDLYYRLSLLMPDIALPIRMIDCRNYKGNPYTTLAGLSVRLDEAPDENLEPEFNPPSTGIMHVEGQKLSYSIYVFKKEKDAKSGKKKSKKVTYARGEGLVFSVNGQNHGSIPESFFGRGKVGMGYLSDSILVLVDCSKMERRQQEKLFMPSRDRLSKEAIRYAIEEELQNIISKHDDLKRLQNRRRDEAIKDRLQDSKPLEDVLNDIIKKSPHVANLFLAGKRMRDPFPDIPQPKTFEGKRFPTYFNLVGKYTENSPKDCPINRRFQVKFKTDAENDYFDRDDEPGELVLELNGQAVQLGTSNLSNGIATLTIKFPPNVQVGNLLCFETKVTDPNRTLPFTSKFYVRIINEVKNDNPPVPPKPKSRFDLPEIIPVKREDWGDFDFDELSALKVERAGEKGSYDFFINVDNIHLKTEMKSDYTTNPEILEARYKYGMVLLAISILNSKNERSQKDDTEENDSETPIDDSSVQNYIAEFTKGISPVLLPMIAYLGSAKFNPKDDKTEDSELY